MTIYVTNKLQVNPATTSGAEPITNTYEWLRGSTKISGATGNTYLVQPADEGFNLSVIQKATNVAGYSTAKSLEIGPVLGYSPYALFNASETGVWFDPSDLSTLFQDSAGTTPVTAVEQPVGLMLDKSQGLVLGPELVTNGTFDTDTTGWSAGYGVTSSTFTASGGVATLTQSGADFSPRYVVTVTGLTIGKTYRVTADRTSGTGAGDRYVIFTSVSNGTGGAQSPAEWTTGRTTFVTTATATTMYVALNVNNIAVGGIQSWDNISVRELPGNHAYQTTSTSRPVLSARYNLLTKTEQFDDNAVWTKIGVTATATTITESADNATHWIQSVYTATVGIRYKICAKVRNLSGNRLVKFIGLGLGGANECPIFSLSEDGACYVPPTSNYFKNASIVATELSGQYLIQAEVVAGGTAGVHIGFALSSTDFGLSSFTGDTGNTLEILEFDLRVANDGVGLPSYQRVNTATDYDTVGFPKYLKFDGIDDWMVTPTITPGIDKVQVFAGVRKLSDATSSGLIAESSVDRNTYNGAWTLGYGLAASDYGFSSKGTNSTTVASGAIFLSPITNVLTGLGDISGDSAVLRINSAQAAINTSDQGTGNYLAYPFYIGRRGGTSLPFNGHIYSLIVRFGANLDTTTIEQTENWVNGKTLAY